MRPARPGDAAAIAEVHVRSWQVAYEHVFGAERLGAIDVEGRRAIAERMLETDVVTVAEQDERVVGFVAVGPSRDAEDEGELYAIYVSPDAWGSGAGPALMAAGAKHLRDTYPTSILWVLDDNPRARRFYEREGWQPDGGTKTETFLSVEVTEIRYRIAM